MRQKVGPGFGQGEECVATYAGAFRFLTRPIPLMLTRMHRHTRTREAIFNLPLLGDAQTATDLSDLFQ